jgi:hypothetical protein
MSGQWTPEGVLICAGIMIPAIACQFWLGTEQSRMSRERKERRAKAKQVQTDDPNFYERSGDE